MEEKRQNGGLLKAFSVISNSNGRLEVSFTENDLEDQKVCVAQIRFPLLDQVVTATKVVVGAQQENALSKGRLSVEQFKDKNFLVGTIRIKSFTRIEDVITSFVLKMKSIIRQANEHRDSDNIGNRIFN